VARTEVYNVNIPTTRKKIPAPILIYIVGITRLIPAPKTTAINELSTRAPADPKNTEIRESQSAEKQKVASWVLSPSSARKIKPKVVINILRSMGFLVQHIVIDSSFPLCGKSKFIKESHWRAGVMECWSIDIELLHFEIKTKILCMQKPQMPQWQFLLSILQYSITPVLQDSKVYNYLKSF
jgi:hypothetical protein